MSKASSKDFKICLLGEGRVGKTSIVNRWINNIFDPDQQSTVDAQMYLKKKMFVDGQARQIALWDTAGQERYRALGNLYYRNADGAVLVYDCTDEDTLDRVRTWIKELQRAANPDLQIVICGNKCDRTKERQVTEERGQKFARKYQADHFSTSAKANVGIDEAFLQVIRNIVAVKEGRLSGNGIDDVGNDDLFGNLTADISNGNSSSATAGKKSSKKSKAGGRLKIVDDEVGDEDQQNSNNNRSNVEPAVSASGTRIGGSRVSASVERSAAGGDDWVPSSSSSGGNKNNNNNDDDNDDSNPYGDGGYYSAYNNNYKRGRGGADDDDEEGDDEKNARRTKKQQTKKTSSRNVYPTEEEEEQRNNHDPSDDYGIDNDGSNWNTSSSSSAPIKKSTPATQATQQQKQQQQQEKPKTITLAELPKKNGQQQQPEGKKCSC